VWFDITTTDMPRPRKFYGELFGWTFAPLQSGGDQAFEIVSRDQPIGTLRVVDGPIALFNVVVYVQVDDLPASCRQAESLGAKVAPGFPFNLQDRPGAIALLADPTGHPIGMYSRTRLPARKQRAAHGLAPRLLRDREAPARARRASESAGREFGRRALDLTPVEARCWREGAPA